MKANPVRRCVPSAEFHRGFRFPVSVDGLTNGAAEAWVPGVYTVNSQWIEPWGQSLVVEVCLPCLVLVCAGRTRSGVFLVGFRLLVCELDWTGLVGAVVGKQWNGEGLISETLGIIPLDALLVMALNVGLACLRAPDICWWRVCNCLRTGFSWFDCFFYFEILILSPYISCMPVTLTFGFPNVFPYITHSCHLFALV